MAEEPGGVDEYPDDAPESSSDSDESPPGDEVDEPATDPSGVEDGRSEESQSEPIPAVRDVSEGAEAPDEDEPIPAIREVADAAEADGETAAEGTDAPLAGEAVREATEARTSDGDETSEASRISSDAPASDGGYADEVGSGGEYSHDREEVYDDDWEPEGAPDDQEMPLADHIEEMVRRLGVVIVVMAIVSGVVFPFAEDLINFLWFSYLPGEIVQCPGEATTAAASSESPGPPYCARVYHPLGLILARLKVATLVGFIVALPVFVYETYLFMRPGLFPHERRYYLASVPTSTLLAAVGVAFAHFLVIPAIFTYFLRYSEEAAGIAFGLTETFDLMVLLMGGFALVFQIPLFIMLALMMDLVTRKWLHDRRLLFWGAFAGIAFLFSPDPTGMAPIIVAATMIVLFEGTLYLAKWTGRG